MTDEQNEVEISGASPRRNRWLPAAAILLLLTTLVCVLLLVEEHQQARQLASGYDQMSVALSRTRSQLEEVTAKMNAATAPKPIEIAPTPTEVAPVPVSRPAAKPQQGKGHHASAKRAPVEDPRWKQVQAELENHQKQISATQQEIEKTRTDLQGNLNSTRDELNGSIARNHEELVVLQMRGERNYFEFDLDKSKQFHRTGPLSISLRKADRKRQYCDVKLLIDDNEITKKHVNLFEPVMLYPNDYAQPLELVINRIDKNEASGYVSAPKYRQSELTAAGTSGNQASSGTEGNTPTAGQSTAAAASAEASLPHRPGQP